LQFLNASFTLLAAGPPRLANIGSLTFASDALASGAGDDIVFPIGIVQNFNLSHNRQFNRIWEVGSERSFFIAGRTVGQVGLSRIMYHGPSLLRVLYAYYQDLQPPTLVPSVIGAFNVGALTVANPHDVKIAPGYENLYLNLASDLFNQPIGLMALSTWRAATSRTTRWRQTRRARSCKRAQRSNSSGRCLWQ
jgi:hypothetical protein